MTGASDIHIDGGGSMIVFTAPVSFVQLINCSNILVTDFTVDIQPYPYTAARVLAVDHAPTWPVSATVELVSGHPTFESNPHFTAYGIASIMTAAAGSVDGQAITKRGAPEVMKYGAVNRTAAAGGAPTYTVELQGWSGRTPTSGGLGVSPGDVLVVDPRIDTGVTVLHSTDVTLRSFVVLQCSNECFTSEMADRLSLLGCGTQLAPGRFLAANNGGHNHHSARVGQWIEGGLWENAGDDTVHVSALVSTVATIHSPVEISLVSLGGINRYAYDYSNGDLGIAVGDLLQFWDHVHGVVLSERSVVRIESVARHDGTRLVLDGPVGDVTPGSVNGKGGFNGSVTQVFNFNRTSNQFVFRSNVVRNGRRVGVLYKGYRAWIENNSFTGLGGGALESWNAPYEGLCSRGVLFRANTVTDVCQLDRAAAPIWTASLPSGPDGGTPCHRDYLVVNNTFDSGPGVALLLDDVGSAAVVGNTFTLCSTDPTPVNARADSQGGFFYGGGNTVRLTQAPRLCQK
jgi:hypothetical protein